LPKHPWIFLSGGRCKCLEHLTVTYGGTCAQCTNKPPQRPIRDVVDDVLPISDSVPAESPYDA
jgi:hypothetical protein